MINQNLHRQFDANLQVTKAFPAAGADADSAGIDVVAGAAYAYFVAGGQTSNIAGQASLQDVELVVDIPAEASHTDSSKKITVTPQDSDDNSSFAAIVGLDAQEVAGVTSTGSAATQLRWKLPNSVRKYVGVNVAITSGGPSITADKVTVSIAC